MSLKENFAKFCVGMEAQFGHIEGILSCPYSVLD
jgi:hypothetical protein